MADQPLRAPERLLWVDSGYFYAGAVWRRSGGSWACVEAAPVIRWMVGKRPDYVKAYVVRKGWAYGWVQEGDRSV